MPHPEKYRHWEAIKGFLEPAAKLGGVPILEKHEEVWTVEEDGEVIAAATGRILPEDGIGEIILCGGKEHKRWTGFLQWKMGAWFRMEGMKAMRIYGRKGWKRELEPLGWQVISEENKVVAYEKAL